MLRFPRMKVVVTGKKAFAKVSGSARPALKPPCEGGAAPRVSIVVRPAAAFHHVRLSRLRFDASERVIS